MKKITSILSDGQWHHFSTINSIWYATVAYHKGYLLRKEEEFTVYEDGKEWTVRWYVFKLKSTDGKLIKLFDNLF